MTAPPVRFGPGGIPIQCKGPGTLDGVRCCAELGLRAMEMEFVQGVRMGEEKARAVGAAAQELDISLSSHAPYFVNLCSTIPEKEQTSHRSILQAAQATFWAGGNITVFHPGYYQKLSPEEAYARAKKNLQEVEAQLDGKKIKIRLGAECVGKKSQFGGLLETIRLSQELKYVVPVLDFSHLHARRDFPFAGEQDYRKLFALLDKELPGYTKKFHAHFAEINYSDKGELNHLPLGTKNEPPFQPLMKMLAENGYAGTIISETPRLDYDAQKMQGVYEKYLG